MKILITGGAGFIGSNLAESLLNDGHSVRILDDFSAGDRRNIEGLSGDLEVIEGSITDPKACACACREIDAISHQAAFGSVPRSIEFPELYSFNNLHGFIVLCNQARLAGIRRVVYASSSSVYGDLVVSPKSETMRGRALSPYAASKQGNEDFAHAFANAYGMMMVGFRYFNVFGPKQNPKGAYAAVIPLFIAALLEGRAPTIFGDGEQARDFTFVANVVQANHRALLGQIPSGSHVVNVACGARTSVNELYRKIANCIESDIAAIHGPDRNGDIRDSLADVSLAKSLLGYQDLVDLDAGLKKTVEWYKNHPERLK